MTFCLRIFSKIILFIYKWEWFCFSKLKTSSSSLIPMVILFFQRILNKGSRDESHNFTLAETKNVLLYVLGIMLYKFGLETYLGSISILAADRFPKENAFTLLGALQGANQACQCVGSILVAPIIVRYPTNRVLSIAIFLFCVMALVLLICEAASGGTLSDRG